jgi:AcrR family transcriptional regulator
MYICSRGAFGFRKMSEQLVVPEREAGRPADIAASRQAERSERTRAELLRAAEVIFARDGFEASRIEDIAAEAGRSRGAFYANFESKTEVFLALRSRAVYRSAREMRERVQNVHGEEARFEAVIGYLLEQICDARAQILQLEFKLFAVRHPEMLDGLAEKHIEAATSIYNEQLHDLFPDQNETKADKRCNTLAIEALVEGFALNSRFSPEVLNEMRLGQMLPMLMAVIVRHKMGLTQK